MISMPLEQAIEKIKEKSELSEEEIKAKIEAKLEQLSGLVSKEGAAYIVANELGVKLFEQTSGKLQIKNILIGMRDVETVGKVTNKYEVREFQRKDGNMSKVGNFFIGDETGKIKVVCWGSQADNLNNFNEGDIIRVKSGYVKENTYEDRKFKEIHLGDKSTIEINPEGVTVNLAEGIVSGGNNSAGEKQPAVRKHINELEGNSNNIEIFGTVVQSFEPRFFEVDPQSGKRIKPVDGKFINTSGQEVTPDYSYVMNAVLDDGTETIRGVFFREQAEKLTGKSREQMLSLRTTPADFEAVKTELLGKQVKIIGRVNKNEMFDRLEFVANNVDANPNPQQEMERLQNKE